MVDMLPFSQMAYVVKAEVEEIPSRHKPACLQLPPPSASAANCSLFLYNHPPVTPLFWPPSSQSENFSQASHIPQNAIAMQSNIPFPAEGIHDSREQENLMNTNGPRAPFSIFPCPWFFPHPDHGAVVQSQPSFLQKTKQEETYVTNQCSATSSKSTPLLDNQHSFLPVKVKIEPSSSLEARTNDLNEYPAEVSQDRVDQQTVSRRVSNEPIITPAPVKPTVPTSTAKHENGFQLDSTPLIKTSADVCNTSSASPGKCCEPIFYSCKKSAEAIAAAEARKRRKELTKLKNLHGRPCRMHC